MCHRMQKSERSDYWRRIASKLYGLPAMCSWSSYACQHPGILQAMPFLASLNCFPFSVPCAPALLLDTIKYFWCSYFLWSLSNEMVSGPCLISCSMPRLLNLQVQLQRQVGHSLTIWHCLSPEHQVSSAEYCHSCWLCYSEHPVGFSCSLHLSCWLWIAFTIEI